MLPSKIKTKKPFNSIFDIDQNVLSAVKEHMEDYGFDPAAPIVIWQDTVIDGHTRLEAAKQAGIENVPVENKEFDSEKQALQYAIHNQRDRRNLTNSELLRCIEALDKRKENRGGGDRGNQYTGGKNLEPNFRQGETKNQTAKTLDVGGSTVSNARAVLDSENEEIKEKVESGNWSVDKGAKEARQEKKAKKENSPTKPTFNQVNENIEWAKWSWNPVTGCKHGCPYCYARDIANRFYEEKFEPTLRKERMEAPANTKIPKGKENEPGWKNVFVCSMGDLFGDWVEETWIKRVLKSMNENSQWNYLLLTKNPKRYLEFDFPEQCWLGATADNQTRMDEAVQVFKQKDHPIKFISCEPLSENIQTDLNWIHWLIVGGRSGSSGMKEGQPEWSWVENLLVQARKADVPIYFKPNLTVKPKEYPEV